MPTRAEEIEREIEETRAEMTRTAAEIEKRLKPDNVMNGAMDWLQGNPRGRALVDDVAEVVSRNPLPIVLVGIGLAWLAYEMTRSGSSQKRAANYRPMRSRMGPNVPASRHHMHVEDGGSSAGGRAPDADELLGRRRGTETAREAAEAFRQMDQGGTGTTSTAGTTTTGASTGATLGTTGSSTPDTGSPARVGTYTAKTTDNA